MLKHLVKHLSAPLAFVIAFALFGAPSAPGVAVVDAVAEESTGVGGRAYAFGPGDNERGLPDPNDLYGNTACQDVVASYDAGAVTFMYMGVGAAFVPGMGIGAAGALGTVSAAFFTIARIAEWACGI